MANEIFGTDLADLLIGTEGDDVLYPKSIILEPGTSAVSDQVFGGGGNDLLVFDCRGETLAVTMGVAGNPRFILVSASGNFSAQGAPDIERVAIHGGSGDDTLGTGKYAAAVFGGGGIDLWLANYSETTANVFLHLDTTHVVTSIGLLDFFDVERINLVTGSGNDNIEGGAFVDYIGTGAGNDKLNAGAKPVGTFEEVDGGDGIDTFIVDAADETLPLTLGIAASPRFVLTSVSDRYGVSAYNVERVIFRGGEGDDVFNTGDMALQLNGRGGVDLWRADYRESLAAIDLFMTGQPNLIEVGITSFGNIERIDLVTGRMNDIVFAGNYADRVDGADGNDTIDMGARDPLRPEGEYDIAIGGAGRDLLIVNAANETSAMVLNSAGLFYSVTSGSGRFHVEASEFEQIDMKSGSGNDRLTGASNRDTLAAGSGNDIVIGGAGGDTLDGGRGSDVMSGGLGQDDLTGGAGRDVFNFDSISESAAGRPDTIHDFLTATDKLDLSDIDANGGRAGNGTFIYIGNQNFHGVAGELRSDFATVQGDINGDGTADFQINFANGGPAVETDVIL